MLTDNAEAVWTAGGEPTTILCGANNKKVITGFAGRADNTVLLLMTICQYTIQ